MNTACDIVVKGRVQGVGFRYSTVKRARRLGVCGWVRNEFDGSVRIHAFGPAKAMQSFCSWLNGGGPPGARVDSLNIHESIPDRNFDDFELLY